MIRDILGFVLGLAFAVWIRSFVVSRVRTGRIHHTDSTSTFSFRRQPIRFTLVAVLFILIWRHVVVCSFRQSDFDLAQIGALIMRYSAPGLSIPVAIVASGGPGR